jgi:hypothetical protein
MKPKLVCVGETFLNGASGHHLPLFQKYFEISNFNKEQSYEKSTTFIYRTDEARLPQRAYRPEWYNQTNFTLVPESGNKIPDGPNDCFITEKTMKPIMYGHPFVVLGDTGTYQQLREWGFHTFPELFDESFDSASDLDDKIALIVETISKFKSKDVNSKIIDNFDLFWNRQVVEKYIVTDMIEPILKFINNGEIH